MAVDRRQKNIQWRVMDENGDWYTGSYGGASLAVLMDIRDELQTLNRVFACHNFVAIPGVLRDIKRNTTKAKRKRVTK